MDRLRKKFLSTFRPKGKRRQPRRWLARGKNNQAAKARVSDAARRSASVKPRAAGQPLASRVVVQEKKRRIDWRHCWVLVGLFGRRVCLGVRPSLLFLLLIAVGAGVGVANWLKGHPLKQVVFESDFVHIRPEVLTPKLSGLLETSLFELDLSQIQSKLLDLPWVARVSLRRVWPDALKISITEKKVRAKWGKHGFVSDQGVIFSAPLTPAAAAFSAYLPELMGKEDDVKKLLDYYEQMSVALAPSGLDIVALTRGSRDWQITLSNNIKVLVNHEGALDKLVRFRQVYEQLGERQAQVASADLRYHHGVAITWRDAKPSEGNS